MDPVVFGLIAIAAALHVTWNVLLKTAGDPLRAATIGMVAGSCVLVPGGAVAWWLLGRPELPAQGIALGIASGVLEAIYFGFLTAAYRRGDLSVVYPIARGSATFLAVLAGVALLGERLGPVGFAGVACLLGGFLWLQRPWRALRSRSGSAAGSSDTGGFGLDPAVAFALATGLTIAAYSAVDRVGSRLISPWLYAGILWVTTAIVLVLWELFRRRRGARRDAVPFGWAGVVRAAFGGLLTVGAYLCILFAFSLAPLTAVAPLRESAIVLASGWGTLRLGEANGRREAAIRIGAAGLIVVGAILLALEG